MTLIVIICYIYRPFLLYSFISPGYLTLIFSSYGYDEINLPNQLRRVLVGLICTLEPDRRREQLINLGSGKLISVINNPMTINSKKKRKEKKRKKELCSVLEKIKKNKKIKCQVFFFFKPNAIFTPRPHIYHVIRMSFLI